MAAPVVVPELPGGAAARAFLRGADGVEHEVRVVVPGARARDVIAASSGDAATTDVRGASLHCSPALAAQLAPHTDAVRQCIARCAGVDDLLAELADILDRAAPPVVRAASLSTREGEERDAATSTGGGGSRSHARSLPPPRAAAFFTAVASQLRALEAHILAQASLPYASGSAGCVTGVDFTDDLGTITLALRDLSGRAHSAQVTLPPQFPAAAPAVVVDAPHPMRLRWDAATSTLLDVAAQVGRHVDSFDALWQVLDDIDARAWVLEPQADARARAVTTRRIALGSFCSVQLAITPSHPRSVCECRFIGADSVVAPLRERYHVHVREWDSSRLVVDNLAVVLGTVIPTQPEAGAGADDSITVECGICYSYRLAPAGAGGDKGKGNGPAAAPSRDTGIGDDGQLPDTVCDNAKCSRPFHNKCLMDWLRAVPDTRQSYGTLFGACPYCSTPISVRTTASA